MTITMARFVEIIKIIGHKPKVIFDVGSLDGKDAERLKVRFPSASVHAFEANSKEWGRAKPEIDGWHNIALWSEPAKLKFYSKELKGIDSFRDRGPTYRGDVIKLDAVRLDSLNFGQPDVIKLDVEGCSLDVLRGATDMLQGLRALHVETEQEELFKGQALSREVFNLLWSVGMILYEHNFCCVEQYDSVWVRR